MIHKNFDKENYGLKCCGKYVYNNNLLDIFFYDSFLALAKMEITYQKANSVVKQFLTEHPSELNHLKHCLAENAKVMQYL